MTTYFAVNPHDPNDRVELESTTRKEAEKEMEQMPSYELNVDLPLKPYSHLLSIAFEVRSFYEEDDIPIEEIRHALLQRICSLEKVSNEH